MSGRIESRPAKVELELAILKAKSGPVPDKSNWIERITGSFPDDEDFEEILRLGKELRDAEQPDYPADDQGT